MAEKKKDKKKKKAPRAEPEVVLDLDDDDIPQANLEALNETPPAKKVAKKPTKKQVEEDEAKAKKLAEMKKQQEINSMKPPVIAERSIDRVPNISSMAEVEVLAYQVGRRGYRFGLSNTTLSKTVWKKKMSGRDAMQLFRGIKRKNRYNRLEASSLPE